MASRRTRGLRRAAAGFFFGALLLAPRFADAAFFADARLRFADAAFLEAARFFAALFFAGAFFFADAFVFAFFLVALGPS